MASGLPSGATGSSGPAQTRSSGAQRRDARCPRRSLRAQADHRSRGQNQERETAEITARAAAGRGLSRTARTASAHARVLSMPRARAAQGVCSRNRRLIPTQERRFDKLCSDAPVTRSRSPHCCYTWASRNGPNTAPDREDTQHQQPARASDPEILGSPGSRSAVAKACGAGV